LIIEVKRLIDSENYQQATGIILDLLDQNPNDAMALFLFGAMLIKQDKLGLAYNICARAAKLEPEKSAIWANYGVCQPDNPDGWEAAKWCLNKSLELEPDNSQAMAQMASLMINTCEPKEARIWANKALKINLNSKVALGSKAFAYLMESNWKKGFEYYKCMLQTQYRNDVQYGNLPMWEGKKGETVIVYGEQGIGEEITFTQVLNDLSKDCTVIYDGMPRVKNLLQRSFPNVHVCGDRWSNQLSYPEGLTPTARIPLLGLPAFYRTKNADFDGKPYLKADSSMRDSIKGLLSSLGDNPKIGIAWTGGTTNSRGHLRTQSLDSLTQVLRTPDVDFISLQYLDPKEEIEQYQKERDIKIHHFPWITEVKDYDLTAALVSELDLIISVPTSVTQLGGALGVETWVLVPEIRGWLFYGDYYVWANSVEPIHNWNIKDISAKLQAWLSGDHAKQIEG